MTPVSNPFPLFTDTQSQIAEGAYVFVGQPDQDPENNPKPVFWNAGLTVPAQQPLRTVAGYIVNGGTPATPYVDGAYSIRVRQANGGIVYYSPRVLDPLSNVLTTLAAPTGSDQIGFRQAGSGAVARTTLAKARETVSITDFGAVAGDTGDQRVAIQTAIDAVHAAGGGSVFIPRGTYRITSALTLYSNIDLHGDGPSSELRLVNNTRSDALKAIGTQGNRLTSIRLRNFGLRGDAEFVGGSPTAINGGGLNAVFADDCHVSGLWVSGFSDGGIAFLNGSYNRVEACLVRYTGQGISHNASAIDVYGNSIVGNTVTDTSIYNGIHLEGSFGDDTGDGRVIGTTVTGNTVIASREAGINIENAPSSTVSGNTARLSGFAGTQINMGIKLFGSYNSTVTGNTVTQSNGYGIVCGANSGETTISGNTTAANGGGSLLLTDSAIAGGTPIQATNDVAISGNNFVEGGLIRSGNVSLRVGNTTRGVPFSNQALASNTILDWYEEGVFTPSAEGRSATGGATYTDRTGRFTRIGNIVHFAITIGWSSHTGTGQITISLPPYAPLGDIRQSVTVITNGLPLSGSAAAYIAQGESRISLFTIASDTGAQTELAMASNVPAITLSGFYRTTAGEV